MLASVPWWRTELRPSDVEAVRLSLLERRITQGPECQRLEAALAGYLEVAEVVVCSSGSSALLLSMLAAGVGPGDEVVVPAVGFIAAANAAAMLGASVRVVDVLASRPLLDPEKLIAQVGRRTRAIVAIHLGGRACDLVGVRRFAEELGAVVIEDAAQALGARSGGKPLGTMGAFGAFSLGLTKLIPCGEGGAVVADDGVAVDRLRRLRNQGALVIAENRFDELGMNFRLSDFAAALGAAHCERFAERCESVRRIYRRYEMALHGNPEVEILHTDVNAGELPLWSEVLCRDRDDVVRYLAQRGIQTKAYHPGMHRARHLAPQGECPNADRFVARGLVLPSGPDQADEDIDRVIEALQSYAGIVRSTGGS